MAFTTGAEPDANAVKWMCVCVMKDCKVNDSNSAQTTACQAVVLRRVLKKPAAAEIRVTSSHLSYGRTYIDTEAGAILLSQFAGQ